MHNGLRIYQAKHCKTTFLALPCISYIGYYSIVRQWAKQHYYARSRNKPAIITELQLNVQKDINICCCSFNNVSMRKNSCCHKLLT